MATIQGVYVALFGRPADPTGLAYFNSVTQNGANLNGIGDLSSTQEYKDRFAGQSNTQIVNSIYQSLFGRDAEATGLNFFVDALNKGTLNIKNIAIAILDGAQGNDKTVSANKVAAADLTLSPSTLQLRSARTLAIPLLLRAALSYPALRQLFRRRLRLTQLS